MEGAGRKEGTFSSLFRNGIGSGGTPLKCVVGLLFQRGLPTELA